ncbi:MAG: hypothetical protein J6U11_02230 [Campylobacter sp.]|nr:hypothetical protein [Campylobacter sp.]
MYIRCKKCDHRVETSVSLFFKLIGGALPVGGFWAWVAYFFAGTGLALPICIAMIGGGVAMLVFKEEIVRFVVEKGYKCEKCGHYEFDLVQ